MSRLHHFIVTDFHKNVFSLSPDQIRQVFQVLRLKPNNYIVCIYRSHHYLTQIKQHSQKFIFSMIRQLPSHHFNNWNITVIAALIKPRAWKMMIQKLSELGIGQIIPFVSQRSVFKPSDDFAKLEKKWQKVCDEATEQAQNFQQCFVRSVCKQIDQLTTYQQQTNLVLDITARQSLLDILLPQDKQNYKLKSKITIMIGPEGGWTNYELSLFKEHGFTAVSLGKSTLRAETAAIYAGAVIHSFMMKEWKWASNNEDI